MTVPEASADVYDGASLGDHNIWPSRKTFVAHPESPACGKDALPDKDFGLCVPSPYPAHDFASLLWRYSVHNGIGLYHVVLVTRQGLV